jgi:hypothetical protein
MRWLVDEDDERAVEDDAGDRDDPLDMVGLPHAGLWTRSREHNDELVCHQHGLPISGH